ncbi:MAG: N-acetylneuraminate synthase family protein [Herbinix sp.]|nr:N-acetylneuraminate synthase family protein [Herbinix sp.]
MIHIFKEILDKQGYYLLAEIGVNYYDIAKNLDIDLMEAAKLMCREAKKAGIDAVKFQTYKAGSLASKNSPAYWDRTEEPTGSQYELFKKFDSFGEKEYKELYHYCKQIDITFSSTPFDFESADYLDPFMDFYKISSSDITNHPFIIHMAKKGKPILLSTGASNREEIERAVRIIRQYNQEELVLLHCVLEYPTVHEHATLNRIVSLKQEYPAYIIGYSDHTKPDFDYEILKTAYNLGAQVIEKHFTLDKTLKGNDHYHAMDAKDAGKIKEGLDYINIIRGDYGLSFLETERKARECARRSIVTTRLIDKGSIITADDLTFKRPGNGIGPEHINELVGKTALKDIPEDYIIDWKDII